jgi:hypothetical protein
VPRYQYLKNINRRYVSIGIDERQRGMEERPVRGEEPVVVELRSTHTNSTGITNACSGNNDSHNVG